eukprot:TRINITY_DN4417_c0_g1_i2.p1 TRINITY_DN4417_c0_g1~~TRINITY_DN4417_c0_g1_i2.p1  ORF type:complete len:628 (+),score=66.31 TRINITY_DN4417_c0_g1_i2:108-1991(+)
MTNTRVIPLHIRVPLPRKFLVPKNINYRVSSKKLCKVVCQTKLQDTLVEYLDQKEKYLDQGDIEKVGNLILKAKEQNQLSQISRSQKAYFIKSCLSIGLIGQTKEVLFALFASGDVPYCLYIRLIENALQQEDGIYAYQVFCFLLDSELRVNIISYCLVINGLLKTRRNRGTPNVKLAYDLWVRLYDTGENLDDIAYRTGLNACSEIGEMSQALQLLTRFESNDLRVYNMIIKGYGRMGDLAAARKWVRIMKQRGVQPSIVTYNTLVHSAVRAGQILVARSFMDKALRENLTLDAWTYASLLQGYLEAKQIENAEQLLEEAKERGVEIGAVGYSTILEALVLKGNLKASLQLLQWMESVNLEPTTVSFNTVLKAFAEQGTQQQMNKLFQKMLTLGVTVRTDTFNTIIQNKIIQQEPAQAISLFRQMLQLGISPDTITYTCIIEAFRLRGQVDACEMLFAELEGSQSDPLVPDLFSRVALVGVLVKQQELKKARQALRQVVDIQRQQGSKPSLVAFGALLQGYAKINQVDQAMNVLQWFLSEGGDPDGLMFEQIVEACLRNGKFKEAQQVIRALQLANKQIDREKYMQLIERVQREVVRRQDSPSLPALERFKWWLGLPNNLYQSQWP